MAVQEFYEYGYISNMVAMAAITRLSNKPTKEDIAFMHASV